MIRLATPDDIEQVVGLTEELQKAVNGPQAVDPFHTGARVLGLIQSERGVVFVSEQGFIAGEAAQTMINPQWVACEHGWFAKDASGVWLLRRFARWADDMGCTGVKMSSAPGESEAGKILKRLGYRPTEMAWFK